MQNRCKTNKNENLKKLITPLLILMCVGILKGQNEKPNRESFNLTVVLDSINFYEQIVDKTPYFVQNHILQIYPSEKLNIEVEIQNDTIHSMKVVNENLNPNKTIIIDFKQEVNGKEHGSMILSVMNPFDKNLIYDAKMYVLGGTEWIPTSIIPIMPKLTNFELWNDIILSLVIDNWKLTSD
jgi:hypothetical protein